MLGFTEARRRKKFEAMTKPHLDALYRTARRMTGDAQTAEDVVQETCLKAYRGLDGFQPGTNYGAWLFRILTNTCIDWRRRRGIGETVDLHALPDAVLAGDVGSATLDRREPDPEANLLVAEFRRDVMCAVGRLSPELRMVVLLAVFEEYSYAEIAEVVGCPIGTVRSRLNRGRQQLQADLAAYRSVDMARARRGGVAAVTDGGCGGR